MGKKLGSFYNPSISSCISKISLWAITFVLFITALVFVTAAFRSLFYLGDVTVPEGAVVYCIKGILSGGWPLYHDYTVPPYSTTPYTPLFYLLSAAVAWASSQSISALYIGCRLLTFAATLGAAFFVQRIVLLVKNEAHQLRYAAFLLPFSILTLIAWGFAARPDMLAVMLSLAGVYIYLRETQSPSALVYSAFALALSWWCKQSFVAAPVAVFFVLLFAKEWQRVCLFAVAYIAAVGALAGATEVLSHGWFYSNIFVANITTLNTSQVAWLTEYGYFYLAPFVATSACLAVAIYFKAAMHNSKLQCIMLYLLTSVALSFVACMKDGAYFNYMLEPLFVASILAALTIHWMLKNVYTAIAAPLLLLASLTFSYHSYWYSDGALENALSTDLSVKNSHIEAVLDKMNALPGDVLTSKSFFAVRSLKPVLATDLFNVRYLEEAGKLSTHVLAERIEHQELSSVMAPEGCEPSKPDCPYWPKDIRQAILEQYAPHETLFGQVFWVPKGK